MQTVHLIIGVPGSGKTWITNQLTDRFCVVPHDDYAVPEYPLAVLSHARKVSKPILAEAPFRGSVVVEALEKAGCKVIQHYLIERPDVVTKRYEAREGKPIPKQHLSNLARYTARARMPATAEQLLARLKGLANAD